MGKVFLALAVCLAAFIGLLIIISMELFSIPMVIQDHARRSISQWQETSKDATGKVLSAIDKLAEHEQVFAANTDEWTAQLDTFTTITDTGTQSAKNIETLLATNSPNDAQTVKENATTLNEATSTLRLLAQNTATPIITMTSYILGRKKIAVECQILVQSLQGRTLTALENEVGTAMQDWPEKSEDLKSRLQRIHSRGQKLALDLSICQEEAAKESEDIDILRFLASVDSIRQLAQAPGSQEKELHNLCQQLYTGWDEILTDMNIVEGETVTFKHTLNKIVITSTDKKDATVTPETTEVTKSVSRQEYEKHKEHLGMALRNKAVGHYNHEVETVAQPPGYSYIAKPEDKQNRYGQWRNDDRGQSYWAWYGQYSFMRSLFWGGYYSPIYMGGYRSYYGYHSMGRSYYGSSLNGRSRYGSSGSYTSRRYSSSGYVRSGGYKSSRYVKSGGTYRGTPRKTSSSSYRSSSRSGSRSGGGK